MLSKLFGGYTPFLSIDSGISNSTVEGLISIPDGETAVGFAYTKEVIMTGLDEKPQVIKDNWIIEVVESAETDARVLFRQEVLFGVNVVSIPGVFIASVVPDEQIKITTTVIEGQKIDPVTAKEHLDLGYQSEFGITSDFVGALGVGGGEIRGTYQSLPYNVAIPSGAIFKIRSDGWRPVGLSRIATYHTSFRPGSPRLASLCDEIGAVHTASIQSGALVLCHRVVAPGGLRARRARLRGTNGATLREQSIGKDCHNRMWIGAFDGNHYRLYRSDDDGTQIEPHRVKMPNGASMQIDIWKNGEKNTDLLVRRAGGGLTTGFATIAQRGSAIFFRSSPDGFTWSEARLVGFRKRAEPYHLREVEATGELLIFNGRLDHFLRSLDGNTWTEKTV